jgi:hypothetical protein
MASTDTQRLTAGSVSPIGEVPRVQVSHFEGIEFFVMKEKI